jgi:hypothetical protein
VFGEGHQDWVPGTTCDECQALLASRRKGTSGGRGLLAYGIERMKAVDYASAEAQEKAVVASARAKGVEPVRYEPNERFKVA